MDHTVGLNAAIAVLAALHRARPTGQGGHVDVAAREVAASLIGEALLLAAAGADRAHGQRSLSHGAAWRLSGQGEDTWISIAVGRTPSGAR